MLAGLGFCMYYGFDESCRERVEIWSLGQMLVAANTVPEIAGLRGVEEGRNGVEGAAEMGGGGMEQCGRDGFMQVGIGADDRC